MSTSNTLPDFELLHPQSTEQALRMLADEPRARVVAGGTDLIPNLRRGIDEPERLIALAALPGFATIAVNAQELTLGAGVTIARLAEDATIADTWPAIAQAATTIAGPGHRTVATLGGNLCLDTRCVYYNQSAWWRAANGYCLKRGGDTCHVAPQGNRCHAAFSGDLAPALLALGAEVDVASVRGRRSMALADLYRDDGAAYLTLDRDELLLAVRVRARPQRSGYRKARVRGAMDFPLAGVACALDLQGAAIASLKIALTGTNSNPLVLAGTEDFIGQPVNAEMLTRVGKLVQKQVSPMRSTATPSNYRRHVASALAQRLLGELASG